LFKLTLYSGLNKFDSLSKFFDSVLDGTANLKVANEEAKAEEVVPNEEDIEIQQKQEAQRIALAHGGFADFIDFEEAIKNGHGADYHDVHGYSDTKDSTAPQKEKADEEVGSKPEEVIAPKVGDDEQVVLEAVKETGHTEAYVVEPEETKDTAAASPSPEPVEEHPKDEL
jgi:protein disulfide-isomerase A6